MDSGHRVRLTLALLAWAGAVGAGPAPSMSWYSLRAQDGQAIGWASQEIRALPSGREVIGEQELSIQGDGPPTRVLDRSVVRQDGAGRTISIVATSQLGRSWSRTEAVVGPDAAVVTRTAGGDRRTARVPLPPGVRFDSGAALLKGWPSRGTPRLDFDQFDAAAAVVEHVSIEALAPPRESEPLVALRKRYDGRELRAVARLSIAPDGRILSTTQPMFGGSVTIAASDRATALKPHGAYRLLAGARVKSPYRIAAPALAGHIRYSFGFRDGISFDLPQTGEQRREVAQGVTVVDVCATCGPGLASDPAALTDALKSTPWLQSDHPRLRAIAAPIANLKVSDARKMELLAIRARPYIATIDFAGHFSALETLSRRSGDCTEAAVLLAALGRAAGIPTKVANGLVYSRQYYHGASNVFMPHSWTLAYVDGAWRSFDLALDTFDASHLALTVGNGDARSVTAAGQLGSLLIWNGLTEVRGRRAS